MSVDAVLLDAGGVFLLPEHDVLAGAFGEANIAVDASRFVSAHYAGMRAYDLEDREPPFSWRAYNSAFAAEAGVVPEEMERALGVLGRAFEEAITWSHVIGSSVDALRSLARTDVRLAIVSNSDGSVENKLIETGICHVGDGGAEGSVNVSVVLDSHVVAIAKPDPRIFEMALLACGVDASRAIHVGDSLRADVRGAEAAGIRPVHLDPYGYCDESGHTHVTSLAGVLALL